MSNLASAGDDVPRAGQRDDTPAFVGTLTIVIAVIGLLLVFDLFLGRVDRRESEALAAAHYADGVGLLRRGDARGAVVQFGSAVEIDRGNVNYSLALGDAMLADRRVSDADAIIRDLLERAENDGAVNLTMAHVKLRERRTSEAKAYFHRAIFGRWGADSVARRLQARFELIDLLAQRGAARELLAELLPLEDMSPDSVAVVRRLGTLFIVAGSPGRAANMFREVLRDDPSDADAHAGLGEAALALGNFRTALVDLREAARLQPSDVGVAARLAVAETVVTLDPTAAGLDAHERAVRSQRLLARTLDAVGACLPPDRATMSDSARALIADRGQGRRAGPTDGAMVAFATALWAARVPACPTAARDDALRLVQTRLAQ